MPEIIDRKMAIALGLKSYFTGKPCKRGHVSELNTHGGCIACKNQLGREFKARNAERIRAESREYRAKNVDKRKEYNKKYKSENSDKIKERMRCYNRDNIEKRQQYYIENADKIKEYQILYRQENKDKLREYENKRRFLPHRVDAKLRYEAENIEKTREYHRRRYKRASIMEEVLNKLGITIPEIDNATR